MGSFFLSQTRLLLFGFFISFFAGFGQTFFISIFNLEIRGLLNLSDGQFGILYSLATLASAIVLIWFGKLIDTMDLRIYTFIVSLGLACACIGMFFLTNSLFMLFVLIFSLRFFGQGAMSHTGTTTMSRYYVSDRGKAISVGSFGDVLAMMTFPIIALYLIQLIGWTHAWLFSGLSILIIFFPLYLYLLKNQTLLHKEFLKKTNEITLQKSWRIRNVIIDKNFYVYLPISIAPPFILTGLIFHQVFIITNKGWGMELLASSYIGWGIFSIIGLCIGGPLIDKVNTKKAIPYYLFPMLFGILFMMFFEHSIFIFLYMALLGITNGLWLPFTGSLWVELYGVKNLGAIRALMHACMVFASALSPIMLGLIIDYRFGTFTIGLFCVVIILFSSYFPFIFRN
ncbi:MAG TPA: MFS transporter [Pelagibacterales bacterium]|nr:MFS transporter [Pelagibacterales bacterium]